MADLNLVLGQPSGDQTMPASAGNVRRVVLPVGTRSVIVTSDDDFYWEEDPAQTKADDTASVATNRQKLKAGSYSRKPAGAGRAHQALRAIRYIYLVGTVSSQPFWVTAVAEGE